MLISVVTATLPEVLIVDDDLAGRDALGELLESRGYSIALAASGREALDYLRSASAPKIIILDLMMPMMDGWEFLQHQSRDFALLQIPVIVLTATPPIEPVRAIAVLQKPIHSDSLFKLLNRYLCPSQLPQFATK